MNRVSLQVVKTEDHGQLEKSAGITLEAALRELTQ